MPEVKISPASIVIGLAVILILGAFGWLTFGPKPAPPPPPVLTEEAKAYRTNLALSDVHMQESNSIAGQRLVEIMGRITNNGARTAKLIEVTCVFYDYYGKELKRERVAVIGRDTGPLAPSETRNFRLAFDDLNETWNQALPFLVIAQIQFV